MVSVFGTGYHNCCCNSGRNSFLNGVGFGLGASLGAFLGGAGSFNPFGGMNLFSPFSGGITPFFGGFRPFGGFAPFGGFGFFGGFAPFGGFNPFGGFGPFGGFNPFANVFNPFGGIANIWNRTQNTNNTKPEEKAEETTTPVTTVTDPIVTEPAAVVTTPSENKPDEKDDVDVKDKKPEKNTNEYGIANEECPDKDIRKAMQKLTKELLKKYLKTGEIVKDTDLDFKKIPVKINSMLYTPIYYDTKKGNKNDYINVEGKQVLVQDGIGLTIVYEYDGIQYYVEEECYHKIPKNTVPKTVVLG